MAARTLETEDWSRRSSAPTEVKSKGWRSSPAASRPKLGRHGDPVAELAAAAPTFWLGSRPLQRAAAEQ